MQRLEHNPRMRLEEGREAMTVAEQNRDLVVSAIDAALAGHMDGFLAALHPEVEVLEPDYLPYGGTYRGREGFLELFQRVTQVLDLPTVELVSVTAGEERAVLCS